MGKRIIYYLIPSAYLISATSLALLVFGLSEVGLGEVVLSINGNGHQCVLTMYFTKSYMLALSFAAISK